MNLDGAPVRRGLLDKMKDRLAFRGPDAVGAWSQGQIGLVHTLLRTSWESKAETQPATLDGETWIVADARIDGRRALAAAVDERKEPGLENAPDPELILRAYDRWGEACVQYLYGDFAFAIWDGRERKLFCARDHLGVKPFYYALAGRCLVFSNTLRCLQAHHGVSDRLDDLAIADYLLFGYKQDPAATSFRDIRRLPPAHSLRVAGACQSPGRYWRLDPARRIRFSEPAEYLARFDELFRDAVEDRLHGDSAGIFLSGGMDSSSVAAAATAIRAARDDFDLRAYTAVADRDLQDSERHFSALTAAALQIPVQYLPVDDYALFERWGDEAVRGPEPGSTPFSAIACDQLRQIEQYSRVALSGDGGDHALYPARGYFFDLLRKGRLVRLAIDGGACVRALRRVPRFGFRSGIRRMFGGAEPLDPMPVWLARDLIRRYDLESRWREYSTPPPPEQSALRPEAYDRLTNPSLATDFELSDPGATLCRVEVRCPLFDIHLIEYLMAIPPVPWNFDKGILRLAMRGRLPETILRRPKTPLTRDPLRSRLPLPESTWVDHFIAHPDFGEYVDRTRIPALACGASANAWRDIRPAALNFWLTTLARQSKLDGTNYAQQT
jgi:asparagine synthase (glutamine-hydrolysing)